MQDGPSDYFSTVGLGLRHHAQGAIRPTYSIATRQVQVATSQSPDMTTESVTSADGTTITYDRYGEGPAVLCLHGSGVTRELWAGLVGTMSDECTLYLPDRRGRGDSGDGPEYSFEREHEDVRALAEVIDDEPILLGSSFGGLLAMATAQSLDVSGLVLYEPPLPAVTVEDYAERNLAAMVEKQLEKGHREEAVKLFFRKATGAENIEQWPIWPDCVELAETIVREGYIVGDFQPDDVTVSDPTLLLTGEHSPGYLKEGTEILGTEIPDSTIVEITGAGHAGVATAPNQVGSAIRGEFFDGK